MIYQCLLRHYHLLSFGFYVVVVVVLAFAVDAGEVELAEVGCVEADTAAEGVSGLQFEECVHTVVALVGVADVVAVVGLVAVRIVKFVADNIQNFPA